MLSVRAYQGKTGRRTQSLRARGALCGKPCCGNSWRQRPRRVSSSRPCGGGESSRLCVPCVPIGGVKCACCQTAAIQLLFADGGLAARALDEAPRNRAQRRKPGHKHNATNSSHKCARAECPRHPDEPLHGAGARRRATLVWGVARSRNGSLCQVLL